MLSTQTGLPIPFTGTFCKKGLHLRKVSLFYSDLWVKLLKLLKTFCLCLFQNMLGVLHVFPLPQPLANLILLRSCWSTCLMGPVVVYQTFILLFDCIHPHFPLCRDPTCLIPFKTFSLCAIPLATCCRFTPTRFATRLCNLFFFTAAPNTNDRATL